MKSEAERLSLFLVEDSPADVFLVEEAMRQEGLDFKIEVAADGEMAMQMVERMDRETETPPPGVMLLDINLPRCTGDEILERVRRSPRCASVPVVVISSSDSPAERRRAFELGANAYFRKPSSLNEFLALGKLVRQLAS
jgi:CheY-like chemotaxis protein